MKIIPVEHVLVEHGDTLSYIALNYYGESARWTEIYAANRDVISDPDLIFPGQVLVIPRTTQS